MINQKDIYVGLNQPSNNELLWASPQSNGSVILSVKVNNGWVAANSESGGGQYYSKQEIDNRFADILGIDAEGIAALKALVEDGSALIGLLGEINDKASLSKANTFTKQCIFQGTYSTDTITIGGSLPGTDSMKITSSGNSITFDAVNTLIEGVSGTTEFAGIHFGSEGLYEWAPGYTSYKRIALEEDVESKTAVTTTTETTIAPTLNSCYRWTSAINSLSVELNSGMGNYVGAVTLIFTTGSTTPSISFDNGTGTVYYQSGISFEASTSYEVNCLWVGDRWIVAVNKLVSILGG